MDAWINTALIGNPVNWVIVTLVLMFGAYAAMLLHQNMGSLIPSLTVQRAS